MSVSFFSSKGQSFDPDIDNVMKVKIVRCVNKGVSGM